MQIFTDRVQAQIEVVKEEQSRFDFDMTPFTTEDCIPDNRNESIVGKVVVINAELNRYEYQHSAYQLVLVDGGHGAIGGRGQAVFGTCLADGTLYCTEISLLIKESDISYNKRYYLLLQEKKIHICTLVFFGQTKYNVYHYVGGAIWITLPQKKQPQNGAYQIDGFYSIVMISELMGQLKWAILG